MDDDTDDDNWIEISNLAQLNAVRWDLDANGVVIAADTVKYAAAFPRAVANMGCATTCDGYELVADLDFDTNNDGRTDIAGDTYWNGGVGWNPIGQGSSSVRLPFQAEFSGSGNGHTISNLFIDRSTAQVGLFGVLGGSGFVHHVGLLNVDVTTTLNDVGALVGFMQGANTRVAASYVGSGSVTGAGQTGGLVGSAKGQVAASWTNVAVDGTTQVGGLVGNNDGGVQNAYALGTVSGSGGFVHGVVGATESGADLVAVYYNSDIHQVTSAPYSKTTFDLQNATGYGGIYGLWNVNIDGHVGNDQPWDFGGSNQYPALKADRNNDGTSTWQEFGLQGRAAPPDVTVTADRLSVIEGLDAQFTITASFAPSSNLPVNLQRVVKANCATVACGNGRSADIVVTILAGQTSVADTVPTTNDEADEYDGSVTLTVTTGLGIRRWQRRHRHGHGHGRRRPALYRVPRDRRSLRRVLSENRCQCGNDPDCAIQERRERELGDRARRASQQGSPRDGRRRLYDVIGHACLPPARARTGHSQISIVQLHTRER